MTIQDFYLTTAWRNNSHSYRKSVGGLCERCFDKGIITPAEVVHHKIPLTNANLHDPNIAFGWNNLQALCRKCHLEVHKEMSARKAKRRYRIDENGRVIVLEDAD